MMATRAYTKVARAESEERTREALLDAAEESFFSGGAKQDSIHALATAAGVSKQTLLRHFGSKEGLFEQAYRRTFGRIEAERLAAPTDDIEAAVENLVQHYEEFGDRALQIEAFPGGDLVETVRRSGREFHYSWVEHAFGGWLDAVPRDERKRLRAALIAICDVRAWSILARDLRLSRAEVRATLTTAVRRLLEEKT